MAYGEMIRTWRKAHGKTQRELADAVGCSDSYIAHLEKEIRPLSFNICMALGEVFELTLDEQQALLAAAEDMRSQGTEKRIRTRGATVRKALRTRGRARDMAERSPEPETIGEQLARELAADSDLRAAYRDLKTALEAPETRDSVIKTLRAFAQMARSGS